MALISFLQKNAFLNAFLSKNKSKNCCILFSFYFTKDRKNIYKIHYNKKLIKNTKKV